MKIISLLIFISGVGNNVIAQKDIDESMRTKNKIQFVRIGSYAGIPVTFGSYMQINFTNKYLVGIDQMYKSDYSDLPPDYKEGLCLFGNCTPKKEVTFISAFIGKSFSEKTNLDLTISTGISWVRESKPFFAPYDAGISFLDLSSNYTASYKIKNTIGVLFVATQEWKISKTVGLNLSVHINFNSINSFASLDAGLSLDLFQKKFSRK